MERESSRQDSFFHRELSASLPAVHQPALVVEGGGGNFSFYHSYAWVTANVATQKVAAEHVTEKHRDTFVQTPRKDFSAVSWKK